MERKFSRSTRQVNDKDFEALIQRFRLVARNLSPNAIKKSEAYAFDYRDTTILSMKIWRRCILSLNRTAAPSTARVWTYVLTCLQIRRPSLRVRLNKPQEAIGKAFAP
jgi:hypothetical protein